MSTVPITNREETAELLADCQAEIAEEMQRLSELHAEAAHYRAQLRQG